MNEIRSTEIAELAGVSKNTVTHWKTRYDDFPAPIRSVGQFDFYDRQEMMRWLESFTERRLKKAQSVYDRAMSAVAVAETSLETARELYDRFH